MPPELEAWLGALRRGDYVVLSDVTGELWRWNRYQPGTWRADIYRNGKHQVCYDLPRLMKVTTEHAEYRASLAPRETYCPIGPGSSPMREPLPPEPPPGPRLVLEAPPAPPAPRWTPDLPPRRRLPTARRTGRAAVYRYFNHKLLLYVGFTSREDLEGRRKEHAKHSAWFSEATRSTTEWFDSCEAASAAEKEAILTEAPLYNRQGIDLDYVTPCW
jgi:hypothetical protein